MNLLYGRRGECISREWEQIKEGSNAGQDRVSNQGHNKEENIKRSRGLVR